MRTVIFDLDGTLVDTSRDLIAAANACFADLGLGAPLDAAGDAATAFRGGRAMLRLGFGRSRPGWTEADVDGEYHRFLDFYEAVIDRETRLYPGAVEAVEALLAAGYRTGICTNKPEALSELLLNRLGVRGLFAGHVGADTLPVRKPDPAAAVRGGGARRRCAGPGADRRRYRYRPAYGAGGRGAGGAGDLRTRRAAGWRRWSPRRCWTISPISGLSSPG